MLSRLFWTILSLLLHRPSFRHRLNSFILQAQACLGIGSGGRVGASGEEIMFRLLLNEHVHDLQRKLCVFDIGANQGQYLSAALHGLTGRPISVHSFEPSAATFAILQSKFGGRPDVHMNLFGLGSDSGEFDLFSDAEGSGLASLTKRRLDHLGIQHDKSERVRIETLDGYCAVHGIDSIDLLKIDVEGHELDVLCGGKAMFARHGIRLVTFEFGGCNIDTRTYLRDFYFFFKEQGMKSFHRIMPSGRLFRIDSYNESLEAFRTTNFLVVLDKTINTDCLE